MKYFTFIILIISFVFVLDDNSFADKSSNMETYIISKSQDLMSEKHCIDGYVFLVTYNYFTFSGWREITPCNIIQVFNREGAKSVPEECEIKNKK